MKILVPIELSADDVENLSMELEVTESSFMTEFIEILLKKAAVVCKRTELSAKEISEVNPYRLVEVVE
jgi:hypothetical protein